LALSIASFSLRSGACQVVVLATGDWCMHVDNFALVQNAKGIVPVVVVVSKEVILPKNSSNSNNNNSSNSNNNKLNNQIDYFRDKYQIEGNEEENIYKSSNNMLMINDPMRRYGTKHIGGIITFDLSAFCDLQGIRWLGKRIVDGSLQLHQVSHCDGFEPLVYP
jgi:hypothetical protein